jgi:hypothetical protein
MFFSKREIPAQKRFSSAPDQPHDIRNDILHLPARQNPPDMLNAMNVDIEAPDAADYGRLYPTGDTWQLQRMRVLLARPPAFWCCAWAQKAMVQRAHS